MTIIVCTPKDLTPDMHVTAAQHALRVNPANYPHPTLVARALGNAPPTPARIALLVGKRWPAGGVTLTVGFLDNPPADLRARILAHMNAWSTTANVQFVETARDAQVRISRGDGGYWSYLGTDILTIDPNSQTMNLQGFTMETPDSEFYRVVRHETGHTLGFPHEHMRRELVDLIDPQKAIPYFLQTQGWSEDQTRSQVLTPLEDSSLLGTTHADAQSIMCYQLPGSITRNGEPIIGGVDIDASDYAFVASVYPQSKPPTASDTLQPGQALSPGQSMRSNNGRLRLILQVDGNVVLYDDAQVARWSTNTGGLITPGQFIMQTDGNLVLYDAAGQPRWASNTWRNPGAFFVVQDDGNLVVYRQGAPSRTGEYALWAAGSNGFAARAASAQVTTSA